MLLFMGLILHSGCGYLSLIGLYLSALTPKMSVNCLMHSLRQGQCVLLVLCAMAGLLASKLPLTASKWIVSSSGQKYCMSQLMPMSSQLFLSLTILRISSITGMLAQQRSMKWRLMKESPTKPNVNISFSFTLPYLKPYCCVYSKNRTAQVTIGAILPTAFSCHFLKPRFSYAQSMSTSSSTMKNTCALLSAGILYLQSIELFGVAKKQTGLFHCGCWLKSGACSGGYGLFQTMLSQMARGQSSVAYRSICVCMFLQLLPRVCVTVMKAKLSKAVLTFQALRNALRWQKELRRQGKGGATDGEESQRLI